MEKRQTYVRRLDENVIITMLAISVVACIILGFKYKNYEPCVPYTILTPKVKYLTGEEVQFKADLKNFKTLQWSFGDNQNKETVNPTTSHTYDVPGDYMVSLSADTRCTQYVMLSVSQAPKVINPMLQPTFTGPQTAEVGKPVSFRDTTKGVISRQWRFGETATVDDTSANPIYTYKTDGLRTVSLVINGDPNRYASKKIAVSPAAPKTVTQKDNAGGGRPNVVIAMQPKNDPIYEQMNPPAEPPPVTKMAPDITEEQLEAELRQVANKLRTAESFSPYLFGNLNIPVSLNNKKTTFIDLCNQLAALKSEKKIKKLDVMMIWRDEKTNAIQSLNVIFKKREGVLGILK